MKGIIEMHRFNICLVVVLSLSCSGVKAPLLDQPFRFTMQLLTRIGGGGGMTFSMARTRGGLLITNHCVRLYLRY